MLKFVDVCRLTRAIPPLTLPLFLVKLNPHQTPPLWLKQLSHVKFPTNDSSLSFKITTGGGTVVVDILLEGGWGGGVPVVVPLCIG